MLRRILGVVVVLAVVGIMVYGGFFLFPGDNFDQGLLALIASLGLLGIGASLLGRPNSPFTR